MIARLLLASLLTLPAGALPGAEAELQFPAGARPDTVPRDPAARHDEMLKCLVHTRGAPVYARPSAESNVVERTGFLDDFYVAGRSPDKAYLFLVTVASEATFPDLPVRTCHGWIRRRHCLVFSGDARSGPEGLVDPRTSIHHKALLVNRLERSDGVTTLLTKVPFVDRPDGEGKPLGARALFTIYYVFAEKRDDAGQAEYLLLGREPRVNDVVLDRHEILGWVPAHRACRWNTREAVEFNKCDVAAGKRTQPCRIFLHADEVKAYLEVADDREVAPIAEEDMSVRQWQYDQARFPLIEDESGPSVVSIRGNTLYKIGFIGDVFDYSSETGTVRPIATRREIEQLRDKVEALRQRTSKVQACFLIDGTFSMDSWIAAAGEAVRAIVRGMQDRFLAGRHLEVSVNYYRDRDDPAPVDFHPFQRPSVALGLLDPEKAVGGGEPYEMTFAAICRRLEMRDEQTADDSTGGRRPERMAFDPEAVKILIVIGDDGNDPDDRSYSIETVCRRIASAGGASPIGFLALPVGKETEYRQTFVSQMRQIAEKLATAELAEYSEGETEPDAELLRRVEALSARVVVTSDTDEIVEAISERFALALAEKEYYQRCLQYLHAGTEIPESVAAALQRAGGDGEEDPAQAARTFGVVWKHRMDNMIARHNLERLQLAAHGVQLFHEGWIAEEDPQERPVSGRPPPAIRHVVLMHKSELNELLTVLSMVIRHWQPSALRLAWKEALDKVTGKDVSVSLHVSPLELMRKHFGIKVKKGLLALTLDDLSRQSAGSLVEAREALEASYYRLKHAYDDQDADYYWVDVGATGRRAFRFRNVRRRDYWWYADGADEFRSEGRAWIEREMLP